MSRFTNLRYLMFRERNVTSRGALGAQPQSGLHIFADGYHHHVVLRPVRADTGFPDMKTEIEIPLELAAEAGRILIELANTEPVGVA